MRKIKYYQCWGHSRYSSLHQEETHESHLTLLSQSLSLPRRFRRRQPHAETRGTYLRGIWRRRWDGAERGVGETTVKTESQIPTSSSSSHSFNGDQRYKEKKNVETFKENLQKGGDGEKRKLIVLDKIFGLEQRVDE